RQPQPGAPPAPRRPGHRPRPGAQRRHRAARRLDRRPGPLPRRPSRGRRRLAAAGRRRGPRADRAAALPHRPRRGARRPRTPRRGGCRGRRLAHRRLPAAPRRGAAPGRPLRRALLPVLRGHRPQRPAARRRLGADRLRRLARGAPRPRHRGRLALRHHHGSPDGAQPVPLRRQAPRRPRRRDGPPRHPCRPRSARRQGRGRGATPPRRGGAAARRLPARAGRLRRAARPAPRGGVSLPPEVTVVMVTWNSAAYLPVSLASLRAQRGVTWELVVVDNASHDDTLAVLDREVPQATVLRNPANRGFAPACNQGIARAQTPYVLLFNPDAVLDPGYLAALRDALAAAPGAAAATGTLYAGAERTVLDSTGHIPMRGGSTWNRHSDQPASAAPREAGEVFGV